MQCSALFEDVGLFSWNVKLFFTEDTAVSMKCGERKRCSSIFLKRRSLSIEYRAFSRNIELFSRNMCLFSRNGGSKRDTAAIFGI